MVQREGIKEGSCHHPVLVSSVSLVSQAKSTNRYRGSQDCLEDQRAFTLKINVRREIEKISASCSISTKNSKKYIKKRL